MTKRYLSVETEQRKVQFLYQEYECSAMHKIPNAYPSVPPSEHMTGEIESTITRIEAQLVKPLSRMYEVDISIKDISEELKMDERTAKRLLKLLGCASVI
ncbi:MAG TPA: hypothetical protein VFZ67_00800 [Nitrososphaera sp.]